MIFRLFWISSIVFLLSGCGASQPNLRQQQATAIVQHMKNNRQENYILSRNYPELGKLRVVSVSLPKTPKHFIVTIKRVSGEAFPSRSSNDDDAMVIDIASAVGTSKICSQRGGVRTVKRSRMKNSFGMDLTASRQKRIKAASVDCNA